ncbi:hypothetical protein GL213_12160 [Halogeometricum borinquense]|uniref:Uncharacterized protein n=1 Tax=Halogeometricum borinquense TaxID=60847 RepID=A0A6C0UDE9_9EURY|nr:hypothetical protein [Halogeometricum borinquense]QIB73384.1 hypothetical protein G3I44_03255 [Halogeometricum borinquense]QIQ77216.1 hypothetical protein GL213_12160 [Halogeometricum borinquense]
MSDKEALYDELAGVVDLFGVLTRAELERALDELAFKQGQDTDREALADAVEEAVSNYYLVTYEHDGVERVVPGPVAFPSLPENAEDLPHILDVDERTADEEAVTEAALSRLRTDADEALESGDDDRIRQLLDVTYDVELWTARDVDVGDIRSRFETELDE